MKHLALIACAAGLLLTGCGGGSTGSNPLPKQLPATWTVQAGASSQNEALQGLDYYPASITINVNDTVVWKFPAGEPHTVAFLGPLTSPPPPNDPNVPKPAGGATYDGSTYTSSGFVLGGGTYRLTFTKAGTYKYYCLIHGEMVGTIVVQPKGSTYPQSQAQITSAGDTGMQSDLQAASNALSLFPYTAGGPHLSAGLSQGLGVPPPGPSSIVRFLDGPNLTDTSVTVAAGTTITWTNLDSNLPHTVTFPAAGQTLPQMDPFSAPSGGTAYNGSALVNSGPLMPGQSFSLTLTKAGTYTYYCLFHDGPTGMVGTVTVQ